MPELVPPNVVHVTPAGDHQLVVYSVCSPEHCWHTFYIRKFEWSDPAKIICRKAVSELNNASDFIAESLAPTPGMTDQIELRMISSHNVFQPQSVTLRAYGNCLYELGKLPVVAASK